MPGQPLLIRRLLRVMVGAERGPLPLLRSAEAGGGGVAPEPALPHARWARAPTAFDGERARPLASVADQPLAAHVFTAMGSSRSRPIGVSHA